MASGDRPFAADDVGLGCDDSCHACCRGRVGEPLVRVTQAAGLWSSPNGAGHTCLVSRRTQKADEGLRSDQFVFDLHHHVLSLYTSVRIYLLSESRVHVSVG